jgi:signal transduction histidine kinase
MKILLVDDDSAVRNVLSKFLIEENCSVMVAGDGKEAFKMLENDLPDVVLTDIKMPVMDGLELLKACRPKYEIPFIMFTGYADMDFAVEALNNGAFYFIHKPINFYEIMAVLNHLRERLQLKRKMEEQRAKLLKMSKLADLSVLIAGLIHEINDPVDVIVQSIERLKDNLSKIEKHVLDLTAENPAENRESLQKILIPTEKLVEDIEGKCGNISKIVQDMSTFTGILSDIQEQPCDLKESVADALEIVNIGSKIKLKKNLEAGLIVYGDRLRLSQIITALLINALEAVEDSESKKIEITSHKEANSAVLKIADSGPGIPEENREKVFTPFFTTKKHKQHKGLGLSVVYGLIAAISGEISFKCPKSGGTEFTVRFPVGEKSSDK